MSNFEVTGIHSGRYQNNYTQSEVNSFTAEFNEVTQSFAECMAQGLHPSDAKVQELVKQHFDFISKFWTANKKAYLSLSMNYVLPSPYKDTYEAVASGLGKYHFDAIQIWAERNL
jgi:hypothetical protein